jgi:tripartite-type tricarboxylate transporter receptor subunit TctC
MAKTRMRGVTAARLPIGPPGALYVRVTTERKRTKMFRKIISAGCGLLALLVTTGLGAAADYPERPVTIVVGFPPGGASDILARIITDKLGGLLGQPFIVDNRPGAGGNVAGTVVAHAAPDGYTLLLGNNAILATNASLYAKIDFDPEKDFAPISLVGTQANVLVVNNNVPAHSLADLIVLAKANPGKLNYASSGYGLAAHLAGELFKTQAHIDIVHVPYKGSAPALQDVIAGDDQMMFATTSGVMGFLKNDQLRPLAVTTLKRTPILPDIPTMDEAGLPGFEATTWHGLVAPAGTPKVIVDTLNRAVIETLRDPGVQQKLAALGVDIAPDTPDEFDAYIKAEIPKWAAVIKASGAQLQ